MQSVYNAERMVQIDQNLLKDICHEGKWST